MSSTERWRDESEIPQRQGTNEEAVYTCARNLDLSRISLASSASQSWSNHLHRLLYWASITPIICGALGPALTLLAISGCVDNWRAVGFADGSQLDEVDPAWVIAPTATAIILGLAANILLLVRMTGNRNFKFLQYWSIILWTLE